MARVYRRLWEHLHAHRCPGRFHGFSNELLHAGLRATRCSYAKRATASDRRAPRRRSRFLLGSRYCETQKLADFTWRSFGATKPGWERVQAICNFVHDHVNFGYSYARDDRTAFDTFHERVGVCRDFAHLAVALCRCMNIPARYCTGYLGDIGVPPDPAPMDFNAWFEAFLGERWYIFDARHNRPRIGRILIARGRDAADVAIATSFGSATLTRFNVVTEEVAMASSLQKRA